MNLSKILVPLIGLAVMLLSGCSSEPSESDIENALKAQAADPRFSTDAKAILATIKVKKLGCKPDDVTGYICTIEEKTEKAGFDGKKVRIERARMIKGSEGWTIQPLENK